MIGEFEWTIIATEFVHHFGQQALAKAVVDGPPVPAPVVPDGEYLVPVYDQYFRIRAAEGRYALVGPAEPDEPCTLRLGDKR